MDRGRGGISPFSKPQRQAMRSNTGRPSAVIVFRTFLVELNLRDLPGESAGVESRVDNALPTVDLRFYPAALVVRCGHLPGHAKAFFRKALKHHREPHSITLDGHQPSHSALRRMGMNGEFNFRGRNPMRIRCCQYLNNVVEQDHRRVKGRLRPMLGSKTFHNARRVIIGIELAQKIHKRQFAIPIPWRSNPAVIWRHVMAA